jgi:NAD(P)-dependent dehydrogenase (short-subunit alcohol dehydrogenase family)
VAGVRGLGNHEAIAAAKAGLSGMVRAAAATYASMGLRLNAVAPGLVDTPGASGLLASEQARKISSSLHPLGRLGEPGDIARLLLFLAQPENSWITGETFSVDGGMSAIIPKPRA